VSRESIQKQVREYVVENFVVDEEETDLADDDSFLESGLIDSTGMLEVIAFLEETFSISVDDDEMVPENLDSIERITTLVASKVG
jgi:acyl carrier protein